MSNKKYRFQMIRDLIIHQEITNQEELLKKLIDLEISITQATLSRDLRELKVSKVPNNLGQYVYRLTESNVSSVIAIGNEKVSLVFSQNIGIIKTEPGYANRLAFEIDNTYSKTILGTIAGDDTVLVVMKEECNREEATEELRKIIPNINK